MAVSNGQIADQTTFNTAFMSRTINTSTVGQVDLANADVASGASVTNIQRIFNGFASALGLSTALVYNFFVTWASDIVGAANDSFVARIQAIVAKFHNSTGHTHDGTQGGGAPIPLTSLAGIVVSEQAIVNGSDSVTVVFPGAVDLGVTDYKVFWSIRNTLDGQTIAMTGKRTATGGTGFTFNFDATIDSDNYVFEYTAMKKTG